jgi:predicted nucleic acid-binding protein
MPCRGSPAKKYMIGNDQFRHQCSCLCDIPRPARPVIGDHLPFWDAMLWASAQRAGVRHMLSEDFQDGFELQGITFINPFNPENNPLID